MSISKPPLPLALIILDGWGYRVETAHNAIAAAHTPVWDALWANAPHTLLQASSTELGLPEGQMGNSEVGHLHMGAGRLMQQDLNKINASIEDKVFFDNDVLCDAFRQCKQGAAVHIIGLLSPGGVHGHERHIAATAQLAEQYGIEHCYLHAILDGRDRPPQSAESSLQFIEHYPLTVASVIGRHFAMDRDKRWSRVQKAYELYTGAGAAHTAPSALAALTAAYTRGEMDEFVAPTHIVSSGQQAPIGIRDGDVVVCTNFRADRMRQLVESFLVPDFNDFQRVIVPHVQQFITFTEYAEHLPSSVAFPKALLEHTLGACVAEQGLAQLRIAETEKYAHVTFFFNGGREAPFPQETRILIPSPAVESYAEQPAMSAQALTEQLIASIAQQAHPLIIANYANPDMVGHTGDFAATVQAIEVVDQCLGKVIAALDKVGGAALITADHGNAEQMYDPKTRQSHTAHTTCPVPLVYTGTGHAIDTSVANKTLCDLAPTLLSLLELPCPSEMTGKNLLIPYNG